MRIAENQFYGEFDRDRRNENFRRSPDDYRTDFQIDRDRLIHSAPFRRLQNKTQVFFSGEYDFYRTRLTHSIEVAQVGRSLCNRLNATSEHLRADFFIDSDLVEAACLAHDLGHPPFGHTGERTLDSCMAAYGGFEGNAQTLRILTEILYGPTFGMNPTRGLLDGVLKYKSLWDEFPQPPANHFLYSEQAEWADYALGGEEWRAAIPPGPDREAFRSIECQIMDWADDTAYSLHDIADGFNAGFITIEKIERWAARQELNADDEASLQDLYGAMRKQRIEAFVGRKIGQFISSAQLERSTDVSLVGGETNRYAFRLAIDPQVRDESELFKRISLDLVFRSQQLQQLERKSDYILRRLFQVFAETYVIPDSPGPSHFHLCSPEQEDLFFSAPNEQERARLACDFLASLTDGQASQTYRRLFDADFGSIMDAV